MDDTDFIYLLLWDREATKLIGKSASQLNGQLEETSDTDDGGTYPLELDTILDKMILFKVVVKRSNIEVHNEVYTVIKISDDEDLIKQFRHSPHEDTFTDFNPDNDMNTPTNTPAKRSILEIESCVIEVNDDCDAQLSSNKFNKVVKKEKLA
ncbi:hypothetical protein HAX54_034352 [Datura stramonium]|uniref:Uncharacterized protein n=1 Tax=Datura stramonium TaxID=4076 RepID=A0ABS8VH19_DATST|nr:hypothetical protein [Datura stramonium]